MESPTDLTTRQHNRALRRFLESAPDADIGALFKEYILESDHQSWEGFEYRDLRAHNRLFQDINMARRYMGQYVVPPTQQPGSVEAALAYLVESFDLPAKSVAPVTSAVLCIFSAHGG